MNFLSLDFTQIVGSLPAADNPFSVMLILFVSGGWIVFIFVVLWGLWTGWLQWRRNKFDAAIEFVLLAIDIPKGNEQSPKAVEHIFSHFFGTLKKGNLKERYIDGYTQMGLSLEIVSIEGYIQFLIRTPVKFRDLVEAAIYAQYPEAEITEVEDYVDLLPKPLEFPHPEIDIWGAEIILTKNDLYPIKTYPEFEHSLSQKLMDPMASLLEIMSRMGPSESLWIQIEIEAVGDKWRKRGLELINKLIGKKNGKKNEIGYLYFFREIGKGLTESFTASIVPPSEMEGAKKLQKGEREWPSMIQHMSAAEKDIVEAIGMKISKLAFQSKIRFIYSANKSVFNKGKGVSAIDGAFKQFSTLSLNGFKLDKKTWTKINYFFKKTRVLARKRRLLWGYRYRSMKRGRHKFMLNTEELATLWHFPISDEGKAPIASLQTVDARKAQAPVGIPYETKIPTSFKNFNKGVTSTSSEGAEAKVKGAPPPNLPST